MGTTSFRRKDMNVAIERQLLLLREFWRQPENTGKAWGGNSGLQERFYAFLRENGFIKGKATRPDKDARQKTSGLRELGLLDSNRQLTEVGKVLADIAEKGDFSRDGNLLDLSRDAWIYFLQLLKCSKEKNGWQVRPFVLLLHVLSEVKELSEESFGKLLPLCIDNTITNTIIETLKESKTNNVPIPLEEVVVGILLKMENYQEALRKFCDASEVTLSLIYQIGLNRDGEGEDRYYLDIFRTLHNIVFQGNSKETYRDFRIALKKHRLCKYWMNYFGVISPKQQLRLDRPLFSVRTETDFRIAFFKCLHLFKAYALLDDYADLNRRYFSLSDVVIFCDGSVRLTPLAHAFAIAIKPWLADNLFTKDSDLERSIPLEQIIIYPLPKKIELVQRATGKSIQAVEAAGGIEKVLYDERYARFNAFLATTFTKQRVAELLNCLEDRTNDKDVRCAVSENADIPTIFEYLVALAWFYISDCRGDVLSYMNLSLGADFLPKSHAGGGKADIVWLYDANVPYYPKHTLLIEVTLSNRESQRHMEMEPVSRHLGEYLLDNPEDTAAYCAFISTELHLNTVCDFRRRKTETHYYDRTGERCVESMKIIPLDTSMLCHILQHNLSYTKLYSFFDKAFHSPDISKEWLACLRKELNGL